MWVPFILRKGGESSLVEKDQYQMGFPLLGNELKTLKSVLLNISKLQNSLRDYIMIDM